MIDDIFISTDLQRNKIIAFVSEIIENKNAITIATVLGEAMNHLEFELQALPVIKEYRLKNPDASFEDFYKYLRESYIEKDCL